MSTASEFQPHYESQLVALELGSDGNYAEVVASDSLPLMICQDCRLNVNVAKLFN